MKKFIIFTIGLCILTFNLKSQDIGFGFKAGLNSSYFAGSDLREGESRSHNSGFHIGATFSYKATDIMGGRAEFIYSQKGGGVRTQDDSAILLNTVTGDELQINGTRKTSLNVSNAYIDIPVMFYARPIKWVEFLAGVNVGFLVNSLATGTLAINDGTTNINGVDFDVPEIRIDLDHNYFNDDPSRVSGSSGATLVVGDKEIEVPATLNAYEENQEDFGKLYETLDFGLLGGINFYITDGLYVGARFNYGLSDITNSEADRRYTLDENGELERTSSDDKDHNASWQISIGFNF